MTDVNNDLLFWLKTKASPFILARRLGAKIPAQKVLEDETN